MSNQVSPELPPTGWQTLELSKREITAESVTVLEWVSPNGSPLPTFSAGAHVVVLTPAGWTRRYSLCNPPGETHRYVMAIQREAQGLGGSISMVDSLQPGDTLSVSVPENHFALDDSQAACVLIAGGIGITPILSMAHALHAQGRAFRLLYCTRDAQHTAFKDVLTQAAWAHCVTLHHSANAQRLDVAVWLRALPEQLGMQNTELQVYACGPRSLMQSVREATRHWPAGTVHFEDFGSHTTAQPLPHTDRAFQVVLARQQIQVQVPADQSILQALRAQGHMVPSSCESGTCGVCRVGLLDGQAEHRDFVLDEEEFDTQIMICVSRATTNELVLDL